MRFLRMIILFVCALKPELISSRVLSFLFHPFGFLFKALNYFCVRIICCYEFSIRYILILRKIKASALLFNELGS